MTKAKWLGGLLISLFFLYVAFRNVNFTLLIESLRQVNYSYLLPIVGVIFVNVALRALRWQYLLHSVKGISFGHLFSTTIIGFMANNVLPVRMGEIVRAYVLGRLEKISKSTSFATVVIERLFDAFTVLALMLVVLLFVKLPPGNADFKHGLHVAGYISLGLYSLTFLLMFAIKRNPDRFISLLSAVLRPLSPRVSAGIISPIHRFRQGLLVIDRVPVFVVSSLYSLAIWAAFGYSIYLAGLAFGIQLGPSATLLILVAICLAMMMPSAPGFVGTYHAAVTYALIMYGISSENAAAFSVVFHAVNYIPLTLTGFLCLWKYQLSLRALRETTEGDR